MSYVTYVVCDCADIFSFNSKKKKKQSRNFLKSKKLFFEQTNLFDSKKFCLKQIKIFLGLDNLDHSLNFETGTYLYIPYLHIKITNSVLLNILFITTVWISEDTIVSMFYYSSSNRGFVMTLFISENGLRHQKKGWS